MNFITLSFAVFFLSVLAMSALFRKGTFTYKFFLLSFNLFFYTFTGFVFVPLLLFVAGMNWFSAKLTYDISANNLDGISVKRQKTRKIIIGTNIFVHVLLLAFYKYYEFFLLNMEAALNYFGIPIPLFELISNTNLIFPIGLSFYTFQGLSYAIDQYRKPEQKPESFFNVLLFVSFFPTILAGPILRGHEFFGQLKDNAEAKNSSLTDTENTKAKNAQVADKKSTDAENSQILDAENKEDAEHIEHIDIKNSQLVDAESIKAKNIQLADKINIETTIEIGTKLNIEASAKTNIEIGTKPSTEENIEAKNARIISRKEIKKDIAIGFSFILSGLFKKVVLASYLSEHIVRDVFLTPDFYSSTTVLIATYAYAMQIYCDFSGYSDIAVGVGRLMGYKLPQNFNAPYLACSLQDFWRRWHITLSLWLRDYLYIPLGGNKKGNKSLNLIVTMTLGGLWHGSHLRFLIWGLMHGIGLSVVHLWHYMISLFHKQKDSSLNSDESKTKETNETKEIEVIETIEIMGVIESQIEYTAEYKVEPTLEQLVEYKIDNSQDNQDDLLILKPLVSTPESRILSNIFRKIKALFGWFITFHFVSLLWIFFRAEDTQVAFNIIERIITFNLPGEGFPFLVLVVISATMFLQFFGPYLFRFFVSFLAKLWSPIQIILIAIACAIILKLGPDGVLPFIYFQF